MYAHALAFRFLVISPRAHGGYARASTPAGAWRSTSKHALAHPVTRQQHVVVRPGERGPLAAWGE